MYNYLYVSLFFFCYSLLFTVPGFSSFLGQSSPAIFTLCLSFYLVLSHPLSSTFFLSLPLFFFYSSFFVPLSHLMCLLVALYHATYLQHLLPNNIDSCFLIILIFLSCHYWYFIPQKLLVKVSKIANPKVL